LLPPISIIDFDWYISIIDKFLQENSFKLIYDLSQLDIELSRKKFGVKSPYFYKAITAGELEEFDALDEY
jgi:stage III sporulation protein SpoIIIAA